MPESSEFTGLTCGLKPSNGRSSTAPAWRPLSLQVLALPSTPRLTPIISPVILMLLLQTLSPAHFLTIAPQVPHSTYTLQIPTTDSLFVSPDLPNAHGLAVDWVSRNLFWTSYDTNKKQINVARLDGSFKNAVVQGLEQPHGLVVHPLRGSVYSPGLGHTRVRREGEDL